MNFVVAIENITLAAVVVSVILSYIYKNEVNRNLFVCVFFYIGLILQYTLKEQGLTQYWYLVFGVLYFVGLVGVTAIKINNITKADIGIILVFSIGVMRNLITQYEYYITYEYYYSIHYTSLSVVLDAIVALLMFSPFVKNIIKSVKKLQGKVHGIVNSCSAANSDL